MNRQIRVFVSSTFRDMQAERDILVKKIFPQLRKLCNERAVSCTEVDLRWGITEEEKAEGKVLPLCLAEVERCHPYFIGLLGERYGPMFEPGDISESMTQAEPWLLQNLGKSLTELEILHAVLRRSAPGPQALFYFRDPEYLNRLPPGANRADFAPESLVHAARLAELKSAIRRKHAVGELRLAPRENYADPEALGERVLADVTALVDTSFPKQAIPDSLDQEAERHEAYARSRRMALIGRDDLLRRLDEQLSQPGKPLVLTGQAGCGKSALLAEWVHRHRERHPRDLVLQHYIGSTPGGASWQALARRILRELKRAFSILDDIPLQIDELRQALWVWPAKCSDGSRRVVLVLDALDRTADGDAAQQLGWLPTSFPDNFCVLISALESEALYVLRRRGCEVVTVPLFQPEEVLPAAVKFLALFGSRQLPRETVAKLKMTEGALNPLYLRVVLDELRQFGNHDELAARAARYLSAPDLTGLFDLVLDRWDEDFGNEPPHPDLVRRSLCLIACARSGLAETEVLDLLGKDGEPLPRLPWAPFFLAAENAFVQRLGVVTFGHEAFRDAVTARWLKDPKVIREFRTQLITYFGRLDDWFARKVEELPWQLAQNQDWEHLEEALTSEDCFNALTDRNPFELLGYWRMMPSGFDLAGCYQDAYSRWKRRHTEPILRAELACRLGQFFGTAGLRELAEQKLRQALHMAETALGENHRTVGIYANNLAAICVENSRFREANDLFNRAIAILEIHYREDDPVVSTTLSNVAELYRAVDQLSDAEGFARQSLAVAEKTLPSHHPTLAFRLSNFARILERNGQLEEAEGLMRRALDIQELTKGPSHPDVATELGHLGSLLSQMASYREAEECLRRALAIDESYHGPEHGVIAERLASLSSLLKATGRLPEAEDCLLRALRIDERVSGTNDPAMATTLNNLACVYQDMNRLAEAEPLFRKALEIDRLFFGSKHSTIAGRLNNLATLLKDMKRLEEAEAAIREALAIYEERLGPSHASVGLALANLAQVLHDLERLADAEPLMRRALDIAERNFGPEHPDVALCLNNLAELLQDRNQWAEAEPLLRRALAIQSRCYPREHPRIGLSLNNLAGLLRRTGRTDQAAALYEQAIAIFLGFSRQNGANHPLLVNTVDNYTAMLSAAGLEPEEIVARLDKMAQPLGVRVRFIPDH